MIFLLTASVRPPALRHRGDARGRGQPAGAHREPAHRPARVGRAAALALVLLLSWAAAARAQQVFETLVVVSPLAEGDQWFLREKLVWLAKSGHRVCVPRNFVTDFASVPRLLWTLLPQWDGYGPAAVMHDYLYWAQIVPRAKADEYMLEAMRDQNVSWLKRSVVYLGMKAGGWIAWGNNTRNKAAGERRVIPPAQTPTEATKTWKVLKEEIRGSNAPETCAAP
jgi:hypothetical protein